MASQRFYSSASKDTPHPTWARTLRVFQTLTSPWPSTQQSLFLSCTFSRTLLHPDVTSSPTPTSVSSMQSLACHVSEAGTQLHILVKRLVLSWIFTKAVPLQAGQSFQALLCLSLMTVSHVCPFQHSFRLWPGFPLSFITGP